MSLIQQHWHLEGADLRGASLQGADLRGASLQGADLRVADLQGADLRNSTLYQNGDPEPSDLVDVRGTTVAPLSQEAFSTIQAVLRAIPSTSQERSQERLKSAVEPGAATLTFASCLRDGKTQPQCRQTYDITHPEQQAEFVKHLHGALVTLSCGDTHIAKGMLRQIELSDKDSARAGLATVLLARMQTKAPCPGLADLSAEDKTTLETLAKKEAERQPAAKAAHTKTQ